MKISNKKTTAKVGRPSFRSITLRRSDYHITFGSKTAKDLNLSIGINVNIIFVGKEMYLSIDSENGYKLFGYKNGLKYTSFACTAKNIVPNILDTANAQKVATFLLAANAEKINGCKCYKVINTPLRID